jgi:UrcA family protein
MLHHLVTGALVFSAALALGAPSYAGAAPSSDDQLNAIKLKYSEADLQTVRGAKALAFRVRVAADHLCGGDRALVRTGDAFARCRDATIDRALASLQAPLVSQALGRPTAPTMQASR